MNFNIGENICIDAGSYRTNIYIAGKGVVLSERSVICRNTQNGEIAAIGDEAAYIEERMPNALCACHPIQGGVICDIDAASELLSHFISKVKKRKLIKPRIMLSVPGETTEVEGRAFVNSVLHAGARQAVIVSSPVVSALGAGCDITMARGLMIMDIGAEKTDVAAISLCKAVTEKSIKIGGNSFTEALKEYIKKHFKLEIGTQTAENAKHTLGIPSPRNPKKIELYGKDISNKLPRKITLSSSDISELYEERIDKLAYLIQSTLDDIPPNLVGDILSDGILLTGGGAKQDGLADMLRIKSGIKIYTAENPELCNIKGTGLALEHIGELPDIVQSYHNL